MDLILIMVAMVTPILYGMLQNAKEDNSMENSLKYSEMTKRGYKVEKFGNFDYIYKRV